MNKSTALITSSLSIFMLVIPIDCTHAKTIRDGYKAFKQDITYLAQRECYDRMGPFYTYSEAERVAQSYRNQGYATSGVWGEGGIISQWSNRRYYFNLFYPC